MSSAGTHLISTSCESVNQETGALQLRVATSEISSGIVDYKTVEQLPAYFPCQEQAFWDAAYVVVPAVVCVLIPIGMYFAVRRLLNSHRGENI